MPEAPLLCKRTGRPIPGSQHHRRTVELLVRDQESAVDGIGPVTVSRLVDAGVFCSPACAAIYLDDPGAEHHDDDTPCNRDPDLEPF